MTKLTKNSIPHLTLCRDVLPLFVRIASSISWNSLSNFLSTWSLFTCSERSRDLRDRYYIISLVHPSPDTHHHPCLRLLSRHLPVLLVVLPLPFLIAYWFLASRLLSGLPFAGVRRGCTPPPSSGMIARSHAEHGDVSALRRNQILAINGSCTTVHNINQETRREPTNS